MTDDTPFEDLISTPLDTKFIGQKIDTFDVIDSTNAYGLKHGEHGTVIVADRQTAGRGRLGRSWHSAPGLGLWFTVCFDGLIDGISFAAALAVRDAVAERCELRVKWPNDLLCNNRKVCGILVEYRDNRTALGIGINVHHQPQDFPPELREKAGSLESQAGGAWDRAQLLRDVLTHLEKIIILIQTEGVEPIRRRWVDASHLVGRRIQCGAATGVVEEIDRTGALVLATDRGLEMIYSGDIIYLDGD